MMSSIPSPGSRTLDLLDMCMYIILLDDVLDLLHPLMISTPNPANLLCLCVLHVLCRLRFHHVFNRHAHARQTERGNCCEMVNVGSAMCVHAHVQVATCYVVVFAYVLKCLPI